MKENIDELQMFLDRYSQKVMNRRGANDCSIHEEAKAG